jgi:hypothetical protein
LVPEPANDQLLTIIAVSSFTYTVAQTTCGEEYLNPNGAEIRMPFVASVARNSNVKAPHCPLPLDERNNWLRFPQLSNPCPGA